MKCAIKENKTEYLVIAGAIITIIFGCILGLLLPEEEHSLNMMAGMFTGFGVGILVVVVVIKIRDKFGNQEKNKQREIESKDERNIEISRMAWSFAAILALVSFAVIGAVFVGLGYYVAAVISISMMYVEIIAYAIAYKVFSKKY